MQESSAANRTNLTVAKEPTQGDIAKVLAEAIAVMIGLTVEVLPAAQARKQQGAICPLLVGFTIVLEK